jgi:hypothetical protein
MEEASSPVSSEPHFRLRPPLFVASLGDRADVSRELDALSSSSSSSSSTYFYGAGGGQLRTTWPCNYKIS